MKFVPLKVEAGPGSYANAAIPTFHPNPGFAVQWAGLANAASTFRVLESARF